MADPHIRSPMDTLDHLTVILYRLGLTLAAPVVTLLPWFPGFYTQSAGLVCAAMCASCLHIYAKSFRLLLQFATWIGLICFALGAPLIGLGGAFITLGGLCYKEHFCFKIPGLQLQPLILAILWLCLQFNLILVAKIFAVIGGGLFLITSLAKWKMPRYFDIGDKTKYEV